MLRPPRGDILYLKKKELTPFVWFISLIKCCRKKYRPPYLSFIKMLWPPYSALPRPYTLTRDRIICIETDNLIVNNILEIYSNMRGHFLNTLCDSSHPFSFVYFGILRKITTKGIIWNTASTQIIMNLGGFIRFNCEFI